MEQSMVRALRGATTLHADTPEQVAERTQELLQQMMDQNSLSVDDVISIFFTATHDIVSAFPATPARLNGFGEVPLMCAQEIPVVGATERCIRVMMHISTSLPRGELHHVYLHDAKGLRDDLPQ